LSGILEIGTGEEKEVSKLTAVTYCQEIVNHPMLIDVPGDSCKLDELIDILTEGDLAGEKVIVFTRFERMVGIGIEACTKAGVKCVRITGKEDEDERKEAQDTFQDHNSGVPVVWITTAGSDAINLQAAKAIVFFDTPFSAGDYLQVLGRMIRIGSIHDRVFALHLVTEDSIDERVMDIVDGKMGLLEAVLGKRIKGDDEDVDELIQSDKGSIDALFDSLKTAARGLLRA
jgi:SNF2 family DNA or RNA helicase